MKLQIFYTLFATTGIACPFSSTKVTLFFFYKIIRCQNYYTTRISTFYLTFVQEEDDCSYSFIIEHVIKVYYEINVDLTHHVANNILNVYDGEMRL